MVALIFAALPCLEVTRASVHEGAGLTQTVRVDHTQTQRSWTAIWQHTPQVLETHRTEMRIY